ncbi:MAG: lysophospholipid acyltransferase family protein [Salinivirgaceae bacterium]|jgi:KDO2-lipid IV(A) lauroyltransferase|nr:lysophospholipid acyltransferase family protein [Salinivirgaceae bacterium]MBR5168416.1 lysophospholipid acyltransferase family protein [Salinivirgaceae bacterium]MBR5957846.1 lysophospholipid acyltransferase family protein [Salinivirgaceae bacterium]
MKPLQLIGYYLTMTLFLAVWILPKPLQMLLGLFIYVIVAHVLRYRRKVIITNLTKSFPQKSRKEINRIARRYYRHLSYMIIEAVNLRFSPRKRIAQCMGVQNPEALQQLIDKNRNVLIILGHYGNWEYGCAKIANFDIRTTAVYKKLSSPIFERFYMEMRSKTGVEPIEMRDTMRKMVELRDSGRRFALLSVADQTPTRSQIHYWLPFLNQDTGVFVGPERLAKKFDMAVLYCEIKRLGFSRFDTKLTLITESPATEPEHAITDRFYQLLEASIREAPENWVWSHRRWKHQREN